MSLDDGVSYCRGFVMVDAVVVVAASGGGLVVASEAGSLQD